MEGVETGALSAVTPEAASPGDSGTTADGAGKQEGQGGVGRDERGKFTSGGKSSQPQKGAAPDDDLEDIKIGSVGGRVPKALAKAMKELERGFHAKSQETARERGQRMALEQGLKSNPRATLKAHGIDPEEFAEMTLSEKIELLNMSPEQRELKDLREAKQKADAAQKEATEREAKTREEKEMSALQQRVDEEMVDAWKASGLPNDLFYVKQMAAVMRDSITLARQEKLQRPLTAKEAASIVKGRFEAQLPKLLGQLDPEGILRLIGEQNFTKLREWDVKRVTGQAAQSRPNPDQRPDGSSASKATKNQKTLNEAEWRKFWEQY